MQDIDMYENSTVFKKSELASLKGQMKENDSGKSEDEKLRIALARQWHNAPWYVSSFGIHLVVFMVLLLLTPEPKPQNVNKIIITTTLDDEIIDDDFENPDDVVDHQEMKKQDVEVEETVVEVDMDVDVDFNEVEMPVDEVADVPQDNTIFPDVNENVDVAVMGLKGSVGGKPGIFRKFQSRTGSNKLKNLERYGGGKLSEKALNNGLAWLARNQQVDGSWKMKPYYPDHKRLKDNVGLTALCMMAFLGAGNTVEVGKYRRNVRMAERYLLRYRNNDGSGLIASLAFDAPLMLMALSESYGMGSRTPGLKKKVSTLIDLGVSRQLPNGGFPESPDDTRGGWHNTTWWLSALKSARQADFKVADKVFEKSFKEMYRCVEFEGDNKIYANIQANDKSPRNEGGRISKMVASMVVYLLNSFKGVGLEDDSVRGMCCLMGFAGTNRNGVWDWPGANLGLKKRGVDNWVYLPEMFEPEGAGKNLKTPAGLPNYFVRSSMGFPQGAWGKPGFMEKFDRAVSKGSVSHLRSWYGACYWYWQGYSFSRLGEKSEYWKAWNNNFKPYLIYSQAKNDKWPSVLTVDKSIADKLDTGDINGSWPSAFLRDGCEPFDEMGQAGATAFCCMMLEVYYRY